MQKTIDSIKKQTYTNYEVWILDGGSGRETQQYISRLESPFFYHSKKDKGIYDAMNKGVALSKGEWFYFLGSGDFLKDENTLELILRFLENKNDLVIADIKYDNVHFLGKNDSVFKSKFNNFLWIKNTLHHQSLFYNRRIFDKHLYNVDYKILADYDLNLKLFKSKINTIKINEIVAICETNGISKKYNWSLYSEEVFVKTKNSTILLKPFFLFLAYLKFILKSDKKPTPQ